MTWTKKFKRYLSNRSMIIGSHDSGTAIAKNKCMCICWPWAQTQNISLSDQFAVGVRLFDLRYKMIDGVACITHTFATSYTIENALQELIECALVANEYIYIRIKRDSSSSRIPLFGSILQSITVRGSTIQNYIIEYDGSTVWQFMNKRPSDQHMIILYSDNNTLFDDCVPSSWIFPQLFDTLETWDCGNMDDAIQRIHMMKFHNNGLPKAIFVDFSGLMPPEIAFELVWEQVEDVIIRYVMRGEINCIMINFICPEIIHELRYI